MKFLSKNLILIKFFVILAITLSTIFSFTSIITVKAFTPLNNLSYYKNSPETNNDNPLEDSDGIIPISTTQKKYVYLTFDDGPDPKTTPQILDILKKENVKATFFVIGQNITYYKKTFNRIVNENHTLGLHSYTHDLKEVYKSDSSFINEMTKSRKLIKSLTGKDINILRFPGGTYKRMTPSLKSKLQNMNYKIYDWHSSVDDGMKPRTAPDDLVKNALSYKPKGNHIIVLLHSRPNNQTTADALPKLINYYKTNGYEFRTITTKTPEYYFYCK